MSSSLYALIFPVIFFTISSIVFGGSQETGLLEDTQFVLFCAYPDFYGGANVTGMGCINDHADPYDDDTFQLWNVTINGGFFSGGANVNWLAEIPYGYFHYASDWLTVSFAKIGGFLLFVPALIVSISTPVDLATEIGSIVTGAYSVIWTIFFYGLYKTISPFVGR